MIAIGEPSDCKLNDGCHQVGADGVEVGRDGVLGKSFGDGLLPVSCEQHPQLSRAMTFTGVLTGRKFELLATPTP